MKNILYIQPGKGIGGAKISLLHILKSENIDITKIVVFSEIPNSEQYKEVIKKLKKVYITNFPIWIVDQEITTKNLIISKLVFFMRPALYTSIAKLINIIKIEHIDIVHTNNLLTPVGAIAAKLTGIPHIWHVRESVGPGKPFKFLFGHSNSLRFVKLLSEGIICISKFTSIEFDKLNIRTNIIRNGIEAEQFVKLINKRKPVILKSVSKPPTIAMVANVGTPMKQHDLFIKAASIFLATWDLKVQFFIFGNQSNPKNKYGEYLKLLIKELKLENDVIWRGRQDNIFELMEEIDVLVHPTQYEGSGRVIMEAMAAGKVVITVSAGGGMELISNYNTGILVNPNDPTALASAIHEVLFDENLSKVLATQAHEYAIVNFDHSETMAKIMKIYKKFDIHTSSREE